MKKKNRSNSYFIVKKLSQSLYNEQIFYFRIYINLNFISQIIYKCLNDYLILKKKIMRREK